MKWYFAVTEATLGHHDHDFAGLMKAAVASALANTDLRPNLIYDGNESELIGDLRAMGVNVHHHTLSIGPYLRQHAPVGYPIDVACGAYLRTDIPDIEQEDDFVLYTDCDVIFLRNPSFLEMKPKYFACAPEFFIGDYSNINTGVMIMNLPNLREELPNFRHFIQQTFPELIAFDQGAFQQYFKGQEGRLSEAANWKPYWGINSAAELLHFHGPKPPAVRKGLEDATYVMPAVWRSLLDRGEEAYPLYLALWDKYRGEADVRVLEGKMLVG